MGVTPQGQSFGFFRRDSPARSEVKQQLLYSIFIISTSCPPPSHHTARASSHHCSVRGTGRKRLRAFIYEVPVASQPGAGGE